MLSDIRTWSRFFYYRYIWKKTSVETLLNESKAYEEAVINYSTGIKWIRPADEFKSSVLNSVHKETILAAANDILNNKMPILSQVAFDLGNEIKWNFDYEVGQEFSSLSEAKKNGCDIKRAWELSRMHQLLSLVKAYYLTEDQKYLEKIINLTDEWDEKNPLFQGVNWSNPMETSIRCANLINILCLCPELKNNQEWIKRINSNLISSGIYIWNNLENRTLVNNNHYLSDLIGLLVISLYFRDNTNQKIRKVTSKWLKFTQQELKAELKNQILPDGGTFEQSTSYHVYDLELVYFAYKLIMVNNIIMFDYLADYARRMYVFLKSISVDNKISFIGDNDNSHLFRFSDSYPYEQYNDTSEILRECQTSFNLPEIENKRLPYSGLYCLQDSHISVFVKCGAMTKATGHVHNDQLGYVLWYKEHQIVGDPGTYCYTSDPVTRDMFRGTSLHSVVQIEKVEQNILNRCFNVIDKCKAKCTYISDNRFEGKHSGYVKSHGCIVHRAVEVHPNLVIVCDTVDSETALSRITFTPEVKHIGGRLFCIGDERFRIESTSEYSVRHVDYSQSYGIRTDTLQIEIPFNKTITYKIIFE